MKKTKIITIANHKGGVGKTTTTLNLAHGLAQNGHPVLVADLDPQGHCATSLGLHPEPGAFYLLTMGDTPRETTFIQQYVRDTGRENLWLLPGDQTTNAAQTVINAQDRAADWIRTRLHRFMHRGLAYILIDTAPSVGGIQERALWAADLVLIPSSTEYLATDGVRKITQTLLTLQNEKGWQGALMGILPTMYHEQLREHQAALQDLRNAFGESVFAPIHRATVLSECPGEMRTIFEKDPRSRAAQEYGQLVERVVRF